MIALPSSLAMRASSESCKSSRNKSYLLLVLLCVSHCIPRANAQIQRLYGHLHERRLPGEPERVEVIVSLKEHCLLSDVTPHLDFYGALLNVLLHRSHALAISIPPANIPLLQANECVVMIEEDAVVHSLTTGRETIPWGLPLVRADSVPVNRNVPCFKVCVIDSGLFVNHPDIPYRNGQANIEGREFNLPWGQAWNRPSPRNLHGTHVAGVIVAQQGNNIGIAGVIGDNSNTCLAIARVFPDSEDSNMASSIDAAMEYCASVGARVINMSLGGLTPTFATQRLYQKLFDEGILIVAASGNAGGKTLIYPASFDTVVSVGAVDQNLRRARFSQYNNMLDFVAPGVDVLSTVPSSQVADSSGNSYPVILMQNSVLPTTDTITGEVVDCGSGDRTCNSATGRICLMSRGGSAFAVKVANCQAGGGVAAIIYNNASGEYQGTLGNGSSSRIPAFSSSSETGRQLRATNRATIQVLAEGYATVSGTSMACPYVAGVAAKIWAARPMCTNTQIWQALIATARDLGSKGRDDEFGHGLVQANEAYNHLLRQEHPCGSVGRKEVPVNFNAPKTGLKLGDGSLSQGRGNLNLRGRSLMKGE